MPGLILKVIWGQIQVPVNRGGRKAELLSLEPLLGTSIKSAIASSPATPFPADLVGDTAFL